MRVIVTLSPANHPELTAELAALPERARAERLRCLARLGLALFQTGLSPVRPETTPESDPPPSPKSAGRRFVTLRSQLRAQFD